MQARLHTGGAGVRPCPSLCYFLAVFSAGASIASLFLGIILGLVTFVVNCPKLLCSTVADDTAECVPRPSRRSSTATARQTRQAAMRCPHARCARRARKPKLDAAPAAVETVENRPARYHRWQATADVGGAAIRSDSGHVSCCVGMKPAGLFRDQTPQPSCKGQEEACRRARVPINYEASAAMGSRSTTKPAPAAAPEGRG